MAVLREEEMSDLHYERIGWAEDADDGDQRILAYLQELGADLAKPRSVRHYLLWPNWLAAVRGARRLRAVGFTTSRGRMPDDGTWWVRAEHHAVINYQAILDLRTRLDVLASPLGGHYDGWEVAPEP